MMFMMKVRAAVLEIMQGKELKERGATVGPGLLYNSFVPKAVTIALLVCASALTCAFVWLVWSPEPVYQGRRLSVWLRAYDFPVADRERRGQADAAMRAIGTNAIPWLLELLRIADSDPWKQRMLRLIYKQHFVPYRHINAWGLNRRAALAFGALGPTAQRAVPQLLELYEKPVSRDSRRWTACALGEIGPAAKAAIPLLVNETTISGDDDARLDAIFALGGIHSEPELVVPVLMARLSDVSPNVQAEAIGALVNFGPYAAIRAMSNLSSLMQSTNKDIALRAKIAEMQILSGVTTSPN